MSTTKLQEEPLTIYANRCLAIAERAAADLVKPIVTLKQYCFDDQACRRTRERRPFLQSGSRLYFAAGLVPHACDQLRRRGFQVCEAQLGPDAARKAQERLRHELLNSDDGMILSPAAGGRIRHQVHFPDDADFAKNIALLSQRKSMLVVAKNKDETRRLEALVAEHEHAPPPRIATSYEFAALAVDKFDLVIFADVESALLKSSVRQLNQWGDTFDCFTLVNARVRRHPREQLWMDALLGPLIGPPATETAAPVVVLASASTLPHRTSGSGLERKRRQFWHNANRNEHIARLACRICQGHRHKLVKEGLLTQPQADAIFAERRPRVTLLVEGREHGEQLRKLLPRWELLHQDEPLASWPNEPPGVICTQTAKRRTRGTLDGVVIRCDGERHWPLPVDVLACDQRAVLVDLVSHDACDKQADVYQQLGWQIVD